MKYREGTAFQHPEWTKYQFLVLSFFLSFIIFCFYVMLCYVIYFVIINVYKKYFNIIVILFISVIFS